MELKFYNSFINRLEKKKNLSIIYLFSVMPKELTMQLK